MKPDYFIGSRDMPCPNQAGHANEPTDYHAWHEWAAQMAKTHTQHRCPSCGFWRVWLPKKEER